MGRTRIQDLAVTRQRVANCTTRVLPPLFPPSQDLAVTRQRVAICTTRVLPPFFPPSLPPYFPGPPSLPLFFPPSLLFSPLPSIPPSLLPSCLLSSSSLPPSESVPPSSSFLPSSLFGPTVSGSLPPTHFSSLSFNFTTGYRIASMKIRQQVRLNEHFLPPNLPGAPCGLHPSI